MARMRWMMLPLGVALLLPIRVGVADEAQQARQIVIRSIGATERSARMESRYTYRENEETHELDSQGRLKATHSIVRDVLYIGGRPYRHVLEKDGKPLPDGQAQKEQAKLDKAVAEASRLSDEEIAGREEALDRKRLLQRDQLHYVPEAYDFAMLGEANLNGRQAYMIRATPKEDYRGKYGNLLRNMSGKLYIDKQDYTWVRIEAESLDNISFGLFLVRISKGTHVAFELTRINGEIWLPKSLELTAGARFLVKTMHVETTLHYSGYKRFQADSHVTAVSEQTDRK